ncbi:glycosyltransferase family 2 protein [Escherichia coli]|uniref:glycosyltransferase family 2 protein n=1 Tax=Escherichia coli TaxID=562 RepID=UPI00039150ED|nr:glycosyltransferase family 2 protein [Escherichia coli]EFN7883571.1 glycosyltransferase family 2 protein [Escherichia coli]EQV91222.1 hypothetical protein G893_02563 [Escherichia coli KOEGE 71 (186a)]
MIEQNKCIIAVVVLFKPEIARIHGLLKSIIMQVDKVVLIDNTDESNLTIPDSEFEPYGEKIEHYRLNNNLGIAKAQNIGIHYAEKSKASHILFLDQDSIVSEGMVKKLLINERDLLNSGKQVAVLGPAFKDEKTGKITGAIHISPFYKTTVCHGVHPLETDFLISSGSLIRMEVLQKIGFMDEELFIDFVDIEWCERAKKMGLRSYVVPDIVMMHNIGNEAKRVLGKNVIMHNDFRHYFIVRNSIYLILKDKLSFNHRIYLFIRLPLFIVVHTLNSSSKLKKIKLLLTAIKDGVVGKMGKGYFSNS